MQNIFVERDSWIIASMLAPLMFAAWGAGWWVGWRERRADHEPLVSKFDDASLAVLGLLLGFTFSMAMVKHDQRRLMVVADSNAIGDFYTCATLLNEPVRTKLQAVIRNYTQLRFDLAHQPWDPSRLDSALPRMQTMQGQMTELVAQALRNGTPISVSLTNTLNGVTSNHAARLAAIRDRLPPSIILLLYLSAVLSAMLVGREQGAFGGVEIAGTVCFILLVSFTVYVTLDLNQPERGLITVSQEPFEHLLSSMSK
jgi:hypothetical protein